MKMNRKNCSRREFLKETIVAGTAAIAMSDNLMAGLPHVDDEMLNALTDVVDKELVDEYVRMRTALTTEKKRMCLQISWRHDDAVSTELIGIGNGVFRHPDSEEGKIITAYEKMYTTSGIAFTHWRTQEYEAECNGQKLSCRDNFTELRIGIDKLIRYGSNWCEFETEDATAYERAKVHFEKHNEYVGQKMAFVCICAGTRYVEDIGDVGVYLDGDGNDVSFQNRMGFVKE